MSRVRAPPSAYTENYMNIPYTSFLINKLVSENNYKNYLEIGISSGNTFRQVICETKHGVDPNGGDPSKPDVPSFITYPYTSDVFFEQHITQKYDIVFIDGLHHADQVLRDIYNSIKHLNVGGTILLHDTKPWSELMQRNPQPDEVARGGIWTGDVWKAVAKFRSVETKYTCETIDFDLGISVIREGNAVPISIPSDEDLTYEYYLTNKDYILNLVLSDTYLNGY